MIYLNEKDEKWKKVERWEGEEGKRWRRGGGIIIRK